MTNEKSNNDDKCILLHFMLTHRSSHKTSLHIDIDFLTTTLITSLSSHLKVSRYLLIILFSLLVRLAFLPLAEKESILILIYRKHTYGILMFALKCFFLDFFGWTQPALLELTMGLHSGITPRGD